MKTNTNIMNGFQKSTLDFDAISEIHIRFWGKRPFFLDFENVDSGRHPWKIWSLNSKNSLRTNILKLDTFSRIFWCARAGFGKFSSRFGASKSYQINTKNIGDLSNTCKFQSNLESRVYNRFQYFLVYDVRIIFLFDYFAAVFLKYWVELTISTQFNVEPRVFNRFQ